MKKEKESKALLEVRKWEKPSQRKLASFTV